MTHRRLPSDSATKKWDRIDRVKVWLRDHRYVFRDIESDEQLLAAREIVNKYPAYGLDVNRLGDLEVMSLAKARGFPRRLAAGSSSDLDMFTDAVISQRLSGSAEIASVSESANPERHASASATMWSACIADGSS